MGAAAYNRGSRVISAQFCMDRGCPGCTACSDGPVRTPRPEGWGSKVRARADAKAAGLLRFWLSSGKRAPSLADLADMVQMDTNIGRETAERAAGAALGVCDD